MQRLPLALAALWWGGTTALSFLAVPLLFAHLGSPAVAGPMAARLFSAQCWAALVLGLGLLLLLRCQRSQGLLQAASSQPAEQTRRIQGLQQVLVTMGIVLLGMLLALLQELVVAQRIVTARATGGDLRLWHSLGSLMVLGQWLCAAAVLWRLASSTSASTPSASGQA